MVYHNGKQLFTGPSVDGNGRRLLPGIKWQVEVYYDPPATEPEQAVLGSQSLTMLFNASLSDVPVDTLIDSGANPYALLSLNKAKALNLPISPLQTKQQAKLPNGDCVDMVGQCTAKFCIGSYRTKLTCQVLDIDDFDFQLILGDRWLKHHKALLNYEHNTCSIRVDERTFTFTAKQPRSSSESAAHTSAGSPQLLSALQVQRALKQGLQSFLVVVKEIKGDSVSIDVPGLLPEHELRTLLDRYQDVFPEELPAGLPPDRGIPHTIPLEPGHKPPYRPMYRYSQL
jgi:predicted aspartyl protease